MAKDTIKDALMLVLPVPNAQAVTLFGRTKYRIFAVAVGPKLRLCPTLFIAAVLGSSIP
ncbi:MAG: hypothetical protein HYX32_01410 [Actinobacteria bacterium]|nr:hypothetical protein [Actinomycetota bacterium]